MQRRAQNPWLRPLAPRELAATLTWLRACAVIGQGLTVLIVAHLLLLAIPEIALLIGIAALAVFGAFAWWRLRQPWPVSEAEVVAHFAVDIGVLGFLLYLTGGSANPFAWLYIMPIALAATALSARYLASVVLLAGGAYLALMRWHAPLPAMHVHDADAEFGLHVIGMAIGFAVSAVLLGFFIWRLARELRAHEALAQRERERALRDEGILAIATQAAGAAHELNTPLSTIRTLLTELRREHCDSTTLSEDLDLLASQAERCRDILRELVQVGAAQLADVGEAMSLAQFINDSADRFRLLRPAIDLDVDLQDDAGALILLIAPGLRHALINLLNNAADASALNDDVHVQLQAVVVDGNLELRVRDHGHGLPRSVRNAAGMRFVSEKRDGLGLGLALANATAERLDGELRAEPVDGGGTLTRLRVPLHSIQNA